MTEKQLVSITVDDPIGNTVFETTIETTESGEFDLLWTAQHDATGVYSVTVIDIYEKAVSTKINFNLSEN